MQNLDSTTKSQGARKQKMSEHGILNLKKKRVCFQLGSVA